MPKTNKPKKALHSSRIQPRPRKARSLSTNSSPAYPSNDSNNVSGLDNSVQPIQPDNNSSITVNNVPMDITTSSQDSNVNLSVLTEQITKTVTNAVMENLRAAGLFSQSQAPAATVQPQISTSNQSFPALGAVDSDTTVSAVSSSSASTGEQTLSFPQSSFTAQVAAAKSGFVSAAIPLHSRVPMKTKEKIWNNEFVELSTLYDDEIDDITISVKSGKVTTASSSKRKLMTIEQWTDAFNVYMSVYRIKFPEQSEHLSTYLNTVRKISNEKGHWHYYDTNFRKVKQDIGLQWNQIHSELYVTALTRKQKQPFRSGRDLPSSGGSRQTVTIKGTCNRFNRGSDCPGCDYKHICKHCGGKHPGFKCWKEHGNRYGGSQATQQYQQGSNPSEANKSKIPIPTNPSSGGPPK